MWDSRGISAAPKQTWLDPEPSQVLVVLLETCRVQGVTGPTAPHPTSPRPAPR